VPVNCISKIFSKYDNNTQLVPYSITFVADNRTVRQSPVAKEKLKEAKEKRRHPQFCKNPQKV